jgi:peptidoglycan/LPS O-acetylase OafA/YrhL
MSKILPTDSKPRLRGVEAARGIAALLVVCYHTALHVEGNIGGLVLWGLPHFGHAGVDFFFVLSGFIITFVHYKDIGNPKRVLHYAQRRFTRVFPFYWTVLAFYLADAALFHPAENPAFPRLISEFFLLPVMYPTIVGGSWTLVFEVMFYSIFAILILNKRLGLAALVVLLISTILGSMSISPHYLLGNISNASYSLEFFLGMGCAYLLTHKRISRTGWLMIAGICLFAATGMAEVAGKLNGFGVSARLLYGSSSALVILGLVERERSGSLCVPKPLAVLGRASYSVYLVHLIAIGLAFHFLSRMLHLTPQDALPLWGALCVAGVSVGILASHWLEHPIIRVTRRWMDRPRVASDTLQTEDVAAEYAAPQDSRE